MTETDVFHHSDAIELLSFRDGDEDLAIDTGCTREIGADYVRASTRRESLQIVFGESPLSGRNRSILAPDRVIGLDRYHQIFRF